VKRVLSERYDLGGNGIVRLGRLTLLGKILPLGNWSSGPGARCLAVLMLLHGLGYQIYWLNARYGERLAPLKRRLRRIAGRR
jgi:hypothetical protein